MLPSDILDRDFGFASDPDRSGSPAGAMTPAEQRRLRRKISNRESARRSRMRKQRHLEGLRAQAAQLRSENSGLAGRLGESTRRTLLVRLENDLLRSESAALRRRLSEIRQVLALQQLQRLSAPPAWGGFAAGNELMLASLIA